MNDPKTVLEPLAGYAVDLWRRIRNRPFTPHSLTKLHNIRTAQVLSGARTAIEIGTYKGVTARRLARMFDKVVTVEIDPTLHEVAKKNCAKFSNIEFHLGDGSNLLPEIIKNENRILFFLDGHYSGSGTGHGDEPEPVLKELDHLVAALDKVDAVVIDDFQWFGIGKGWPRKSEVLARLEKHFPQSHWAINVLNDQIIVYRHKEPFL